MAGLLSLKADMQNCRRCDLYRNATQAVGGEGSRTATMMLVGEQPGDREDLAGLPFVGPAGNLLDSALKAAEITRKATYVTNAVKHFKNEPRGKRRLHKRPNSAEIEACRWWLIREIDIVKPQIIVALGATAAQSVLQRRVLIGRERGKAIPMDGGIAVFITTHPASLLRQRDEALRHEAYKKFVDDLRGAAAYTAGFQERRLARSGER